MKAALASVLLAALPLASGPTTVVHYDHVVVMGKRVGPWRIGMGYVAAVGLLGRERHPRMLGQSCVCGPATAAEIDYYNGYRVFWHGPSFDKLFLSGADTTSRFDHTTRGLVLGRSTLADARRLYPGVPVEHSPPHDRYSLAPRFMVVWRATGYEQSVGLTLWFDTHDLLIGLGTSESSV